MNSDDNITRHDINDDGEELVSSRQRPAWAYPAGCSQTYEPQRRKLFRLCGVTYFGPGEKKRWRQICREVDRGKMPIEWVNHIIDNWVAEKNKKQVVIVLGNALTAILNVNNMLRFVAQNKLTVEGETLFVSRDTVGLVSNDTPGVIRGNRQKDI